MSQMRERLRTRGYRKLPNVQVRYVVGHGDTHAESSWARRLPGALRLLLGARSAQQGRGFQTNVLPGRRASGAVCPAC